MVADTVAVDMAAEDTVVGMAGATDLVEATGLAADTDLVGIATVDTGDLDFEDMAVIMRIVLIFAHIPIGIGIHIIIHIGDAAGCRDIGNMVIGFPVIMSLAIKRRWNVMGPKI